MDSLRDIQCEKIGIRTFSIDESLIQSMIDGVKRRDFSSLEFGGEEFFVDIYYIIFRIHAMIYLFMHLNTNICLSNNYVLRKTPFCVCKHIILDIVLVVQFLVFVYFRVIGFKHKEKKKYLLINLIRFEILVTRLCNANRNILQTLSL